MNKIIIAVCIGIVLAGVGWYVLQPTQTVEDTDLEQNIGHDQTPEDIAVAVRTNILGAWRSSQDEKFTRTFAADTVTDTYEGEVTDEDPWIVFTATDAPSTLDFSPEKDTAYIQIQGDETLTFKVARLTPETLELVYMERGGTLIFEKVTQDVVRIDTPQSGATITNPVSISGEARGTWYFEASFPIEILNADRETIGQGVAQADGDWMTEDFVPFTAEITYDAGTATDGFIVLHRDNPSGLPENDASIEISVQFTQE